MSVCLCLLSVRYKFVYSTQSQSFWQRSSRFSLSLDIRSLICFVSLKQATMRQKLRRSKYNSVWWQIDGSVTVQRLPARVPSLKISIIQMTRGTHATWQGPPTWVRERRLTKICKIPFLFIFSVKQFKVRLHFHEHVCIYWSTLK